MVSKLSLEVRGSFGGYGRCNICLPSGVDPLSKLKCTPGEYFCTCGDYWKPYACNSQASVGAENITTAFGGFDFCTWEQWIESPWVRWG